MEEEGTNPIICSSGSSENSSTSTDNSSPQEKFLALSTEVIQHMTLSMQAADRGQEDIDILQQTIDIIPLKDHCPIFKLLDSTFAWDIVKIFYHNERMEICKPSTTPHGGAADVLIFKQQTKNVAALKIYTPIGDDSQDIFELFQFPIFECFSTLYIKSFLDQFSPAYFKFSTLNIAGLNINPDNQQKSFFMLFEGAAGDSVDGLCTANLIISDLDTLIGYITDISKAFAELHQLTKVNHLVPEKIRSLSESYFRVSNNINQHLLEDGKFKVNSFGGGEILLTKIQAFKEHVEQQDSNEETAYLRDLSLTHEDAHIGNIFYDVHAIIKKVTFIDYETALRSFRKNGDPLKDLGFFLGSLWQKIALVKDKVTIDDESLYQQAKQLKEIFVRVYLEETKQIVQLKEAIDRVTLYMWSRMCYSGELIEYSQNVIKCIQFFGERDLTIQKDSNQ